MSLVQSLRFEVYERERHYAQVKSLFELSFEHELSDALWHWKMDTMHGVGLCAFLEAEMIAFYGGMPRKLAQQGDSFVFLQIRDVMVHPKVRGILRRKGPFVLTAKAFLDTFVQADGEFCSAFGFPNDRAFRIGELSNLYEATDKVWEYRWQTVPKRRWSSKAGLVDPQCQATQKRYHQSVAAFQQSTQLYMAGDKSWDYLNKRYLEHPAFDYQIIECRSWWHSPVFAVVKPLDDQQLELMDLIGATTGFANAIQTLQDWAHEQSYTVITGWVSDSMTAWIAPSEQVQQICRVPKPKQHGMTWTESMNGKLWLMAGDTDFK